MIKKILALLLAVHSADAETVTSLLDALMP